MSVVSSANVERMRLGSAALERELGCRGPPAVASLAEHVAVGNEDVVEDDLIEVMGSADQQDRADRHALPVQMDEKLRQPVVAVAALERCGAGKGKERVCLVGSARPHLAAVEPPATLDLDRAAAHGRKSDPASGSDKPIAK